MEANCNLLKKSGLVHPPTGSCFLLDNGAKAGKRRKRKKKMMMKKENKKKKERRRTVGSSGNWAAGILIHPGLPRAK